ncbi:Protein of unknown function [Pyronema omphalodes CBS 100304]|uniref:Uncharacterized protein n=1 Tax=Pyronema omphalodes (strain CBS 100304) TaxID=1076935 RepID=U4KXD7_PYROM|nr:Protein of unknown function [Pyronema omphalodes CBS 100304]
MDYEDSEAKATKLRQGGRKDFMKYLQRKLKGYEKNLKIFQQRYVEAAVLHNRALRGNSQEEIPRWEGTLFRAANRKDAQILQLELFKYAYDVMEAEESYYLTHVEWEKASTKLAITKERYFRGEATE